MKNKKPYNGKLAFSIIDLASAMLAWSIFFLFRKLYVDKYPLELAKVVGDKNFIIAMILLPLMWYLWYDFTGQYYKAYRQSRLKMV
ncbi:MAG: hypothetical protein KDC82_05890, partial [Bacteroidetes bacterium]|nr:hypothetical protein [Bacteroidota bacterium]